MPQATLTISTSGLAANYRFFQECAVGATCASVVKADGYGLGAQWAVETLLEAGCDTFFVAHLEEAIALQDGLGDRLVNARLLVLNGVSDHEVPAFRDRGILPVLNSLEQVGLWVRTAPGYTAAVHVDTGMNRLGIPEENWDDTSHLLSATPLALIISHLACASTPEHPLNDLQRQQFLSAATRLPPAPLSLAASAGALLGSDFAFDLIRPGIGLYGGGPLDDQPVPLSVVATLEAPILQIRQLGPGDQVGYGATWQADRRRTMAVVALGYADGLLRTGSNRGFGVLGGAVCPIIGRVSMDLIALDVTDAGSAARVGAMVEFLGPAAPLDAQAQACGTIPYELLTGLGRRFRRTVTE